MASVLKVESLQELTQGQGINIVGKITGQSGDLITADGRLAVTRRSITVTEDMTANVINGTTYTGIQVEHIIPSANVALPNEVLSKNSDGSFSFRAPVTSGDTGISADFTNFIDGGGPATVFISSQANIDGGGV